MKFVYNRILGIKREHIRIRCNCFDFYSVSIISRLYCGTNVHTFTEVLLIMNAFLATPAA